MCRIGRTAAPSRAPPSAGIRNAAIPLRAERAPSPPARAVWRASPSSWERPAAPHGSHDALARPRWVENVHHLRSRRLRLRMSVFLHVNMLQKQQPVAKIALMPRAVKVSFFAATMKRARHANKLHPLRLGRAWSTTWESFCGAHLCGPRAPGRVAVTIGRCAMERRLSTLPAAPTIHRIHATSVTSEAPTWRWLALLSYGRFALRRSAGRVL